MGPLVIELSKEERLSMVGYLIAIREAVRFDGLVAGKTKRNLITENKRIVNQLVSLPEPIDRSDQDQNENGSKPFQKKQKSR